MYRDGLKRIFDFLMALVMLAVLWPLLLLIAAAVKLTSNGPALFRQERGGLKGEYFTLLKFRSMAVDHQAESTGFEPGAGMRVTGVGKFLRKTKLDELPQLINVLKGDMSFVGPRPEVRTYIELYPQRWREVHSVRPGITDPASIEFRNEEDILAAAEDPEREYRDEILPRKLDLYEEYVNGIGPLTDLKLIFATVAVVLKG